MSRRRRGFTLIEVLISIALAGILIAEMSALFGAGLQNSTRNSAMVENDRTATSALSTVLGEFREALAVDEPEVLKTSSSLTFQRPSPDGSGVVAHVHYYVKSGCLLRKIWTDETEPPDTPSNVMQVGSGLARVEFTLQDSDPAFLSMTVLAVRGPEKLTLRAAAMARPNH